MVQYCVVPMCKSNARTPGTSFHRFPKNQTLRKLWTLRIKRDEKQNVKISSFMRVCSKHFNPEDITISKNGKRRILKSDAVPHFSILPSKEGKKIKRLDRKNLENFAGVQVKVEQDADNEINNFQENNTISTNIVYLKSAESREATKNTPLQIQENVSQVVDSFVHKAVSIGNMAVAQKATSERQSSEDTETASGRGESVNESLEENEDATVQKVVGSSAHKAVSYRDSVTTQRPRRESLSSEATESASEGGSDVSEDESVQEIEDDSIRKKNSFLTKRISELEAENEELRKENKKLKAEIKTKDDCLTYLSELMKFSSFKSENEES